MPANPVAMIGQILDHYRIVEKIGAGSMGIVYLGRDEKLERNVAIKILPPGLLAEESARKRFRREALALARLNHPNIATIFEFGSQNDVDFLVTEYIAGLTLDARLARGPVSEPEVISLGIQLASGLAAAHQQGVLHRDLKPANLRITSDGRLKILDFGLAQMAQPDTDAIANQTQTSDLNLSGTLPYISPEQLRGEKADARNDVWALGVVLYELATATLPFRGRNTYEVMSSILTDAPAPLSAHLSPGLSLVIERCLVKEVNARYQSANEVRAALEIISSTGVRLSSGFPLPPVLPPPAPRPASRSTRWIVGACAALLLLGLAVSGNRIWKYLGRAHTSTTIESIAVLPLKNLTGDPEQEYLVDGMTNVLITDLAKLGALKRVIAADSAMLYKDTKKTVPQIARELGVDAIVTGAVVRVGDQFEITTQLVNPATQSPLWSDNFRRGMQEIMPLQSEIARAIARASQLEVTSAEQAQLNSGLSQDPEAYRLYLKGRYFWNKKNQESLRKGFEYFRQALDKDPTYALAYVGQADTYLSYASYGIEDPKDALAKAKASAARALEIDGQLAEAHTSMGVAEVMDHFDWKAAQRELQIAIQLNPNNAQAYQWQAIVANALGKEEEGIRTATRAQELDPLSPNTSAYVGFTYYLARRYDEALREYRKTLELDSKFTLAYIFLGLAQVQQGKFEQAISAEKQAVELQGGSANVLPMLAYAYAAAGQREQALAIVDKLQRLPKPNQVEPNDLALIYTALHDNDKALHYLDAAYEDGSFWTVPVKLEPALDPLRSDPRFRALLVRSGIPPD
jgi:TolB-like protein/Flp pilus assembly protein TadD